MTSVPHQPRTSPHITGVYIKTFLTIPLSLVLNSPANDFTRSISSHRDALNSISNGLKPLFAMRFTARRRKGLYFPGSVHFYRTYLCFHRRCGSHTGAVGSVWRIGRLPHAFVSAEVTVHRILGDAVAVFAVEGTVHALLFIGADELSIDWAVRLLAGCPWKRLYDRI